MFYYVIYYLFLVLLHDFNIMCLRTNLKHLGLLTYGEKILNERISSNLNDLSGQNENERKKRAVTSKPERKWKDAIIPYEFEPHKFTEYQLSVFKQAMLYWENYTCIKFVERKLEDQDYVIFTERKCQCCSFIGKKGGPQEISFSISCTKFGIVLHELGHLVGFWHEHTRPDRDENVSIIYKNIKEDQKHNFDKMNKSDIDSLGSPYDYDSIMHYSRHTFTKSFYLDTIRDKYRTDNEIGQRTHLSKQDINQARLLYNCPINGQTLERSKGVIEFYEYLNMNKIDKDQFYYEWRLVAASISDYYKLEIEEIHFNFFDNFNCNENYLLILDGYTFNSQVIKKICPSDKIEMPLEVISKNNRVLIIYRKSKINTLGNLVFKIDYETQCGGHFITKTGNIQSPNYPLNYPSLSSCIWTIQVNQNHKIILDFERFHLEKDLNCSTDYVEIRDGKDESGQLINKLCGSIIPNHIQSTSNKIFIKFISDSTIQKYGFNLTYKTDLNECELNIHNCEQLCINTLDGYECDCLIGFELENNKKTCRKSCGGTVQVTEKGLITSPGYPIEYRNFLWCKWQLIAPFHCRIFVNFTDFDLEESDNCHSDSLTIKSKHENDLINHGKYCGSILPNLIISNGNILLIDFKTDKSETRRGFSMNYYTNQNECQNHNCKCN